MSTRSNVRAFLCSFTFSDGRRCRTPRSSNHPHLCYFHARKEAQSLAAEDLARDISFFFSGKYLSACDLNAALGRLFVAIVQGHVKPRTARTLAYLAQTMSQTIHRSQNEFTNAFGGDFWRALVRESVTTNWDHLNPPDNDSEDSPADSCDAPSESSPAASPTTPSDSENPPADSSPLHSAPSPLPNQPLLAPSPNESPTPPPL